MKKAFSFIFILMVIVLVMFNLSSCNKDDDGVVKNTERIKQLIYEAPADSFFEKYTFSYTGEELSLIMYSERAASSEEWAEFAKIEYTYSDDEVTAVVFIKEESQWIDQDNDLKWTFSNGLVTEIVGMYEKHTYRYDGSDLSTWNYYYSEYNWETETYDSLKLTTKGECTYVNDQLNKVQSYDLDSLNNWYLADLRTYTYSGDKLSHVESKGYETNNEIWYTDVFDYTYSGELISECNGNSSYSFDDETYTSSYASTYKYTTEGLLSEIDLGDGERELWEYEKGNGNASQVFYQASPEQFINVELPYFKSASLNAKKQSRIEKVKRIIKNHPIY